MNSTTGISYYLNKMLPAIKQLADDNFLFRQVRKPPKWAHCAHNTVQLL